MTRPWTTCSRSRATGEKPRSTCGWSIPAPSRRRETKIDLAVSRIVKIWEATRDERSTQLVFCDLSTPDPERFNVYDDVRSKLIEAGVPADEIAFIHDAETDAAKKLLFDAVNAGRVRILLGSTEKMGAGTNVQRRLVALHHLDAPWRPRDIEQREGRILRQGNANKEVQIYPLRHRRLVRRLHVADPRNQGPLHPAGDAGRNLGALGGGPGKRRAHLRGDQGDRLRQSGRRGKDQDRHGNPQARPAARRSRQPAASHPLGDSRPAAADRGSKAASGSDRSRHRNQKRERFRRVQYDGRQSGFLRQGRAGGSGQGSDVRDPFMA